jgi:hypothetical protein
LSLIQALAPRACGDELDDAYLASWANQLRVDDLLARARGEAGG